jgi:FkbM family methyltransferase
MTLFKLKKLIIKYVYRYFIKPNYNLILADDFNIQLNESKIGELRLKQILSSNHLKTVIDIGASYGDFIHIVQEAKSDIKIYGFEPIVSVFKCLQERYNSASGIELYNLALGNLDGIIDFNENDYSYSSSILPIGEIHTKEFPFTKNFKKSQIEIACLDTIFKNRLIQKPLLIKVDVQGYEENVLSGGENTFTQADFVLIEMSFYELYQGQALFDAVHKKLYGLGFFYAGSINQLCSPNDGAILQQDALYIRGV